MPYNEGIPEVSDMEGYQRMHEKLDIKILILFILRRLPGVVDPGTLAALALGDDNVGYFEYAVCLSELVEGGHVTQTGAGYEITEKGDKNCAIVESSLPYTLRARLEKKLTPMAASMRRRAMIEVGHEQDKDGTCRVSLRLSDGLGEIASLRLLCGGETQAEKIEKNFREFAEVYYNKLMELLLTEETGAS